MNLLYLTVELPYLTGGGGGNLRQYHLLRSISKRHHVTLVSAVLPWEWDRLEEVRALGVDVRPVSHPVPPRQARPRWSYWLKHLRTAADPEPHESARFRLLRADAAQAVHGALAARHFDLLQVDHTQVADWVRWCPRRLPRVLIAHNILSLRTRRAARQTSWRRRWLAYWEWLKTLNYERRAARWFDRCVVVSAEEQSAVRRLAPGLPTDVVPNGVDLAYFQSRPDASPARPWHVVFVGTLNYEPNAQGITTFVHAGWPLVRAACPQATVSIVGRQPLPEVVALDDAPGVQVIGPVADVRPYLEEASVVVVPLWQGAGTRLKILEALAMSKAVVSTPIGAEGIKAEHGQHILLAETPETLANAVVQVLRDRPSQAELGQQGRALVESRYGWEALATLLETVYERTLRMHPPMAPASQGVPDRQTGDR